MATAKKLPSGSWRCQVYSHTEEISLPDGSTKQKRIYKSFTCADPSKKGKRIFEQEAATWAADKENDVLFVGNNVSVANMTLRDACERYIIDRTSILSPGTVREYKRSVKKDMQNIMLINLFDLTQGDIQEELNRESQTHSPKTIYNMHGFLSAVLGTYRPDFALHTTLPQKVRPKIYVPTDEEVKKILDYVQGSVMEIPILLAAFGPMRRSEICALTSDHIKGNIVHVERAMVMSDSHTWVLKYAKTYAGDRYIPIPDFVAKKLKRINGRIVELNPDQISKRFRRILGKCDVPHFRFHDLRHYCASFQHALGIPDSYIMQRGGWGDDNTLKNVYRHTMTDREKEMNAKTNIAFSELCNTKCNTISANAVK